MSQYKSAIRTQQPSDAPDSFRYRKEVKRLQELFPDWTNDGAHTAPTNDHPITPFSRSPDPPPRGFWRRRFSCHQNHRRSVFCPDFHPSFLCSLVDMSQALPFHGAKYRARRTKRLHLLLIQPRTRLLREVTSVEEGVVGEVGAVLVAVAPLCADAEVQAEAVPTVMLRAPMGPNLAPLLLQMGLLLKLSRLDMPICLLNLSPLSHRTSRMVSPPRLRAGPKAHPSQKLPLPLHRSLLPLPHGVRQLPSHLAQLPTVVHLLRPRRLNRSRSLPSSHGLRLQGVLHLSDLCTLLMPG